MKKIGIITLNGNNNFGNKLQNFAVQKVLSKYSFKVETIPWFYDKSILIRYFKDIYKNLTNRRFHKFKQFDKKINYSKYKLCNYKIPSGLNDNYYAFVVGSDQVWNPNINLNYEFYLLKFAEKRKRISFSASFGVSELPNSKKNLYKNELQLFKSISVREDSGMKIVEELTGRKDVEVLLDPTMLLTAQEWDNISKKPRGINKLSRKKYILNYFLGNLSNERKSEIKRIAEENDCEVINLLDPKDPFYAIGPSEFLWLEKNAFLICTDSFHSCVFAILFNRPFIIFDRQQDGLVNINSRIDTLINKFKLENRKYNDTNITYDNLKHDYSNAYKILDNERLKANEFIEKALEIK